MNMLEKAEKIGAEIIRLRRDFHMHPELSFQEFRTAGTVADTLREIGIRVEEGVGRTGVVGYIGNGDGPTIGIRADMDALPITQANDVPYKSINDGVMHACGHDSHTAMLLGAAHLLQQSYRQEKWHGNVRLFFQPAEETADENGISGALAMVNDNIMDGVDEVIALHIISNYPSGQLKFCNGPSMAAVDTFEVWLRGTGGHGAYPHEGTDPIYMLSHVLPALYAIPSRMINPLNSCVVTVGEVHAGTTSNVIPNEVYLHGTIRSFVPEIREKLWAEIERAVKMAELFGGTSELKIQKGYPPAVHAPEVNDHLLAVARDFVDEEDIVIEPLAFGMGAEDFAYMSDKAPGAMFLLGAAMDDGVTRHHHTDTFDIDESVLPLGSAMLAETARRFVTKQFTAKNGA